MIFKTVCMDGLVPLGGRIVEIRAGIETNAPD
jgi:hypothetical protein